MKLTMQETLELARREAADVRPSPEAAVRQLRAALLKGVRWRMAGELCWCPCKRTAAWKDGTKQHTLFCQMAAAAIDDTNPVR